MPSVPPYPPKLRHEAVELLRSLGLSIPAIANKLEEDAGRPPSLRGACA